MKRSSTNTPTLELNTIGSDIGKSRHQWINSITNHIDVSLAEIQTQSESLEALQTSIDNLDDRLYSKIKKATSVPSATESQGSNDNISSPSNNLVELNIGGHYVSIERHILLNPAITWNWFSALFHPRWDTILPRDKNGRIYLEWEYKWIEPILETYRVAASTTTLVSHGKNKSSLYSAVLKSMKKTLFALSGLKDERSYDRLTEECMMKLFIHITTIPPSIMKFTEQLATIQGWFAIQDVLLNPKGIAEHFPKLRSLIVDTLVDVLPMEIPLLRPYLNQETPSPDKPMLILGITPICSIIGIVWTPKTSFNHSYYSRFVILWDHATDTWLVKKTAFKPINVNNQTLQYNPKDGISITSQKVVQGRILTKTTIKLPFWNPNIEKLTCTYWDENWENCKGSGGCHNETIIWVGTFEILSNFELAQHLCDERYDKDINDKNVHVHTSTIVNTSKRARKTNSTNDNHNKPGVDIFAFDNYFQETQRMLRERELMLHSVLNKCVIEIKNMETLQHGNGLEESSTVSTTSNTSTPEADGETTTEGTLQSIHSGYDQLASFASPSHQALRRDDVIFFNVHGTTVCILKSTILHTIPDSQLAIRFCSGDWQEQESTLDGNGHVIVNYPTIVFLPFIEFLRAKRMFQVSMSERKTIFYPSQTMVDVANDMLSYYAIANIVAAVSE